MKRNTRFLGLALAGVVALLLPLNADASCGSGIAFGSYYSELQGTTNGPSLRSNFWILNAGDPAIGPGVDNGPVTETDNWIIPYPLAGGPAIFGDWATITTYNGCPDPAIPTANQAMIVSLSDVDGGGNMTYAVVCAKRDPAAPTGKQFSMDFPPGCTGSACAPIVLVQAPKALITNTTRVGNEANITVAAPNFASGFYGDGSALCTAAQAVPQYDVYKQTTGRGVAPDNTTDVGASWVLVGTGTAGAPVQVTTTCGTTNCDNYLAVVPRYNSNFNTGEAASSAPARVGVKSGNVHAGPSLAVTPKPKKIKNEHSGAKDME